jgi:membrane-associated protein
MLGSLSRAWSRPRRICLPSGTPDSGEESRAIIDHVLDIVLHLDVQLGQIIDAYGFATYALLFVIIFAETGLVLLPFLPGDSLLFAAGAYASTGSLNIWLLLVLLMAAAVLGDTVNYWIGHFIGARIVSSSRLPINKGHLERTNAFFLKHGGKTIILARFVPVVRTFAPFVAGAGGMDYRRFIFYNVTGGVLWVSACSIAGYVFGNIPFVRDNFSIVIVVIVAVSLVPFVVECLRRRRRTDGNCDATIFRWRGGQSRGNGNATAREIMEDEQ